MTVTSFTPDTTRVFRFQVTLDGAPYSVTVPWNVYRQGWYVNVLDQSETLVVTAPLVGSPPPPQGGVDLIGGYFASTMHYYPASGTFVVTP